MTIKKRLTASNLAMLAVPMALIVLIAIGVLAAGIGVYQNTFQGILSSQSVFAVKASIEEYAAACRSGNPKKQNRALRALEQGARPVGYRLKITRGDTVLYSSFSDSDAAAAADIARTALKRPSLILIDDRNIYIDCHFEADGVEYAVTALSRAQKMGSISGFIENAERLMTWYLAVILVLAVAVIALTNGVLSSRVAKSLLDPLGRLGAGARQIRDGNLDFELSYDGRDEFGQVFSDFNEMRLRLKDSVRLRQQYEENRREFIAGISHDLRTPLTAIRGYVEGLLDGVASTPEKRDRYLATIRRKTLELEALVERLFLLSKLETGRFPFHFSPVELSGFLRRFVDGVREEFLRKGLRVAFCCDCPAPVTLLMDGEQMGLVFYNLLENSVKYKQKEQGACEIRLRALDGGVELLFSDDGPGVPEGELQKIFTGFYRADPARSGEGSGLGLAIARRIIEAHGGKILAENRAGLTVRILLFPAGEEQGLLADEREG